MTKTCSKCKQSKPIDDFNRHSGHKDGHRSECKKCKLLQTNAWRNRNKEHINSLARNRSKSETYRNNVRERVKRWKKNNPDKKKADDIKRRSKQKDLIADLTTAQWEAIKSFYNFRCVYCGLVKVLSQDHIIPIAKGGHHTASNIVPACVSCNSSKGVKLIRPSVMHTIR